MKFGIFDQNDFGGLPLQQQYKNRLELAELYDRSGFHCFHMSEHHSTPLSTTPSPSVYLGALTQRTSRMRLCPLVYLLPMYHPVRLYEEICMLDHLSGGRFEFGVGRGASPHELDALGIDPALAAKMYAEAFQIIDRCFSSKSVSFEGDYWNIRDYSVEITPSNGRPPMWYALASPESAVWPSQQGMNIVCGGPVSRIRAITERYGEEWAKAGNGRLSAPLVGVNRYIVVAGTTEEAKEIGRKAWPTFYGNFMKLWKKHGTQPVNAKLPPDFDALVESGHAVVGDAAAVRDALAAQIRDGGLNYLIGGFMFGDMPQAKVLESVSRFAADVMPALVEANKAAA